MQFADNVILQSSLMPNRLLQFFELTFERFNDSRHAQLIAWIW